VCDLETSRIGAPYIYDISNLRVNVFSTRTHGKLDNKRLVSVIHSKEIKIP